MHTSLILPAPRDAQAPATWAAGATEPTKCLSLALDHSKSVITGCEKVTRSSQRQNAEAYSLAPVRIKVEGDEEEPGTKQSTGR